MFDVLRRGVLKIAAKPAIIRFLSATRKTAYHRPMFSYRHAFHAGNHADVLKHAIWTAILRRLVEKDKALHVVDTHAGTAMYRLYGDAAQESQESAGGILQLAQHLSKTPDAPAIIEDYMKVFTHFNGGKVGQHYPGSAAISAHLLRPQDRLEVFEVHPTDHKTLRTWAAQVDARATIQMTRQNSFEAVKRLLPPASRRGALLCDPSYELKSDYGDVVKLLQEAMLKFSTGVYMIWIPQVARPEAHELPRKLRSIANKANKPWLHALLQVRGAQLGTPGGGLAGSSVFVVNPTFGLRESLAEALPYLVKTLGQDKKARFDLQSQGT